MTLSAALRVIDIRTPPAEEHLSSSVTDDIVNRLAPMIRNGRGNLDSRWHFELEKSYFPEQPNSLPGTAFGPYSKVRQDNKPSVCGVRFSISAVNESIRGETCLIGWLAWRDIVTDEIWAEIITRLDRDAKSLGSLCPLEEPEKSSSSPWLATLRLPPWIKLSDDEQAELAKLRAVIGWSAIKVLGHITPLIGASE
jgi:hypothetical protein